MKIIHVSKSVRIEVSSETVSHWANLGKLDALAQELTECMPSMFDKVYEGLSKLALERWGGCL